MAAGMSVVVECTVVVEVEGSRHRHEAMFFTVKWVLRSQVDEDALPRITKQRIDRQARSVN